MQHVREILCIRHQDVRGINGTLRDVKTFCPKNVKAFPCPARQMDCELANAVHVHWSNFGLHELASDWVPSDSTDVTGGASIEAHEARLLKSALPPNSRKLKTPRYQ